MDESSTRMECIVQDGVQITDADLGYRSGESRHVSARDRSKSFGIHLLVELKTYSNKSPDWM